MNIVKPTNSAKTKMDEAERVRRAQEPEQRAKERKRHAADYVEAQSARDSETSARLAKLKALRLAAVPLPAPEKASAPPAPGRKRAARKA